MSVDPVAAGVAELTALVDAELAALAADAAALHDVLVPGMVVDATVLPSNGLGDLISIAGFRVAASLPPGVYPGETLRVSVTSFDGDRIQVQIVGTASQDATPATPPAATDGPQAPPPLPSSPTPAPAPAPSAPAQASSAPPPPPAQASVSPAPVPAMTAMVAEPATAPAPSAPPPPPPQTAGSAQPQVPVQKTAPPIPESPRPLIVPRGTATPPISRTAPAAVVVPPKAGGAYGVASARSAPPSPPPGAAGAPQRPEQPPAPAPIEARLAALRATTTPPNGTTTPARPASPSPSIGAVGTPQRPVHPSGPPTPASPAAAGVRQPLLSPTATKPPPSAPTTQPPAAASRFVAPPAIETVARRAPAGAYAVANSTKTPSALAPSTSPSPPERAVGGLQAYTEPVALLRALKLPVTPSNVASATLALQRPERLPSALDTLERALPRASADPHVATLRTLLAFVGKIDPRSPVLAAQVAAYVDHVVQGAEPKLATLLAATQIANEPLDAPQPPFPSTQQPIAPAAVASPPVASPPPQTQAQHAAPPASQPPPSHAAPPETAAAQRPIAAAVAGERAAALGVDLKQTILTIAADPATPKTLAPALAGALTALTAVQTQAASMLATQPDGLAFALPLVTQYGQQTAKISVTRDGPQRGGSAEAASFRIAFVLETAHFGTISIDVITVGREVTVDVRAETGSAVRAFRDALGELTARLESLRYRVASAQARVGTTTTIAVTTRQPERDSNASVDRSA